jgi:hypothetical protein
MGTSKLETSGVPAHTAVTSMVRMRGDGMKRR